MIMTIRTLVIVVVLVVVFVVDRFWPSKNHRPTYQ